MVPPAALVGGSGRVVGYAERGVGCVGRGVSYAERAVGWGVDCAGCEGRGVGCVGFEVQFRRS